MPPDTSERTPPNLSQKGWYLIVSYPGEMEGSVDLGGTLMLSQATT